MRLCDQRVFREEEGKVKFFDKATNTLFMQFTIKHSTVMSVHLDDDIKTDAD